ncbi:MAG: ABC transporter permease [Nitrospirota bacterium]
MFYVALRILLQDKFRSLVTILGIIFAVSLIFLQMGIYLGLTDVSSVIGNVQEEKGITPKDSKNSYFSQLFPDYIYYQRFLAGAPKMEKLFFLQSILSLSFFLNILLSFITGMLIAGQTIYNSTVEHLREFGTLRAMGASNFNVNQIIYAQALISALLGYIVSLLITMIAVKLYEATDVLVVFKVSLNLLVLGLTLMMCLFSAFFSVEKVMKIEPALLFRD